MDLQIELAVLDGVGPILCEVDTVIEPCDYGDGLTWWRVFGKCAKGTPDHHGGW
ncbi:hypothetical protein KRMM14A1259_20300 [Krasilnikovia sp. MM14-A1259]